MQRQLSVAIYHGISFQAVVRALCKPEALQGPVQLKYYESVKEFIPYSWYLITKSNLLKGF